MIAYLKDKDVSVEVPDDISENDLSDIQKNFDSYFPENKINSTAPVSTSTDPAEQPKSFKRNFFEGYLKSVIPSLAIADSTKWAFMTPEGRAFSGKALDSFSFGLTKPLIDPHLQDEYKNHPIYDVAGEAAGGIGSLLATGGALKLLGLGAKAAQIGQSATQIGTEIPTIAKITAAAPRFITPAIMSGATFGTNTFIRKTVEAFQNGAVDIEDFGKSVAKDTLFGSSLGAIGGLSNVPTAISSAYGLGFISAKTDGADNTEAHLNGAIWAAFELLGSFGREAKLRAEALDRLGGSFGEYVKAKSPNVATEEADAIGKAFVRAEAEKIGGIDSIIKGDNKDALRLVENINQRVRGAKVEVKPEIKQDPLKIENKTPGTVKTSEPVGPVPVEPVRPVSSLDQVPQPIGQAPLVIQGTSPVSEALPSNIFPLTEVSSDQSIAEHPNFKQLTDDAGFIVNKYAQMRGVEPTKDLAVSLYREFHDTLGQIMRAPPEKRLEVATKIKSEFPNIEQEFTTLKDKVYSDETEKYFNRNIANNYSPLNRNVPGGTIQSIEPKEIAIPENQQVSITQEMIHNEAKDLQDKDRESIETTSEIAKFVSSNGGIKSFGKDAAGNVVESEEFKDIPIRFKRKNGLYADELAQMWSDTHPQDQITADELRNRLKNIPKKKKVISIEQYYDQAKRNIEELFSNQVSATKEDLTIKEVGDYFDQMSQSDLFFDKLFPSSKGGTTNRQFGELEDQIAGLKKSLGGLEYIKKIEGPELVQLAKMISGNIPLIKKLTRSLGYFKPNGEQIVLSPELFKDPKLWEAVLAHEIGHLIDFNPEKTMNRGNILGRIASFKDYLKSLLPESPDSTEVILTSKDRARFRSMAEKIAKGTPSEDSADVKFDPQTILNVWNMATSDATPELLDYIKGLDSNEKKVLIKSAMQAIKKGEKITVYDINKFNKDAKKNLKSVSDIYRDILKEEIKKRKLWENEVIRGELKNLTQYWKPFDDKANTGFTTYRYSSPELYADFISVLFNAPAKALQISPNAYKAFFNYLENKPEVMKDIIEIQSLIQSDDMDLQKVRGERILKMFSRAEQAFRARALDTELSKKSTWDKMRIYFWDKNSPILDLNEKLRKEVKLEPSQDAQYAIEKNSMLATFVKSYLDDFDRLVYDPAKKENLLDDVKTVLFLDRVGADRSEMANPLGHTPKSAKEYLSYMEKQDPEKYAKVNEIVSQAREWFKNISSIPGANDFFTPEQLFTIGLSDKYAPFRVVDYMRDYVSAGFSAQMGTFKDIGDPLTSIAMKGASVLTAIERNRLKKIIGEMLLRSGTLMRPAEITQTPGNFKIKDPSEPYLGTLAWKSGGKWQAYHVDKYIADVFNTSTTSKIGEIGSAFNALFQNNIFRGMWITFSPSFQSVNLIRDMLRTWKVTPGLTFPKLIKSYIESIPEAKARAAGLYNPLIQQMERAGALQLSLNDLIIGQTSEDKELETFLQKYDIVESPESKYKNIPIIHQITQAMDYLRYVGDTIESIPKIVGWKALDNMNEEEQSYFVRNFVGTPNSRRAGLASPVTNSILMFSNIFKEGYRGLIETAFTNEKTRKDYWTKTFISTFLPKIAMALAGAGFFGIGVKRVMDKASEYHKTNYVVIPIGVDGSGNGVYLTIPQDEDARLIGGLFWKSLHTGRGLANNLTDILAFGAGQFPGVAPLVDISSAWIKFLSGGNPEDTFRNQKILTDQERSAGGMYAFEPMARWTLNETGLFKLDIRDRLKDEPIYKPIIASIPILQRFLKISQQGDRETAQLAAQKAQKIESRTSIDIKQAAMDAIRQGKSIVEFSSDAKSVDEAHKLRDTYNRQKKGFTSDPYVQALNGAASKDQKLEILKLIKSNYQNKDEFNDYLNSLYLNKIISARLVLEARD